MASKATEVVVRFLGDTTGFDSAVDNLQKSSDGFSKNLGRSMQAAGATVGTFGVLVTKMAAEGEQDQARLETAIKNTGGSYDDFAGRIDNTIKSMNQFGADNNDTQQALTKLVNATHDTSTALDQMQLVADVAAAKHISLSEAAGLVAKIDMGKGARSLAEFGIVADKSAKSTDGTKDSVDSVSTALSQLSGVVAGSAAAQADTMQGKFDAVSAKARDVAEAVGSKIGPALVVAGPLMSGLGTIMTSSLVPSLISAATAGWAAVAPWLPFIAIAAAVGVAIYALYKNWDTVSAALAASARWLGGVFSAIWDGIVAGFVWVANTLKSVANWVIDHVINPVIGGVNLLIRGANIINPGKDIPSIPQMAHLARGGIVTGPTTALIGEGGQPEAVVPLDRAGELGFGGGGGPNVNLTVQGNVIGANTRELRDLLVSLIDDHFARGGALSNGRGGTLAPA